MIFENTGALFTDEAIKLLRPDLEIAFSEADLDPRVSGSVLDVLGFVQVETRTPNAVVTSRGGVLALPEIGENGERPKMDYKNGDEKGYKVKMFGGAYSITKLATKTIRDSGLDMALYHPTVVSELESLGTSIKELGISAKMAKEDMATALLVKGFSVSTANGAGSPSPDGLALFDAHASGTNVLAAGSTAILNQTNLIAAIDLLSNVKNDKGAFYKLPTEVLLVAGRKSRVKAFDVLNNGSEFAASVKDTVTQNGVTMNIFTAEAGYKVGHLTLETIGQPDANGVAIGTGDEWFVVDANRIRMAKALRLITLWNPEVDNYIDQKTKEFTMDIDLAFTVDHFKAEIGIIGSQGV